MSESQPTVEPKPVTKPVAKTELPKFEEELYHEHEDRLVGNDPKLAGMPGYQAPHIERVTVTKRRLKPTG